MEINVKLKEKNNEHYLIFCEVENMQICLTQETNSDIDNLFYKLLEKMVEDPDSTPNIMFVSEPGYKPDMYVEIAEEYISQLNIELKLIYKNYVEEILPSMNI